MPPPLTIYVELQVTSHFSFLRGASSPDELFAAASLLGAQSAGHRRPRLGRRRGSCVGKHKRRRESD